MKAGYYKPRAASDNKISAATRKQASGASHDEVAADDLGVVSAQVKLSHLIVSGEGKLARHGLAIAHEGLPVDVPAWNFECRACENRSCRSLVAQKSCMQRGNMIQAKCLMVCACFEQIHGNNDGMQHPSRTRAVPLSKCLEERSTARPITTTMA